MKRVLLSLIFSQILFSQQYDVIVVGAGISGIAAAKELHEAGYDVLVLEARNYIGGRTHTSFFPNHPTIGVDMGAAWIQGINGNPLIPLAKEYGARNQLCDYDSVDYFDCTPPVQAPPLKPIDSDPLDDLEEQVYKKIKELRKNGQEMSLTEALTPWIQTFSEKEQYAIWYLLASDIEQEYGADCSDLSLLHYDDDDDFGGPDNLMIDGYQPLINGLAAELLQKSLIQLEQPVTEITYSDQGATVTANGISYTADYVICTVPLGVLKQKTIQFTPPFPSWKEEAMGRVHMGILDKTVLLFPSVFWDSSKNLLDRIPVEEGNWVETIDYMPFTNQPVLVAFNAGTAALNLVETQSDTEVIGSLMKTLRSIYGNGIPDPIDSVITRWGQDPYSFGSYSHLPPGATMDDYDTLAKPLQRLRFAGEATINYPGSAHGAYLSGIREAKAIQLQRSELREERGE